MISTLGADKFISLWESICFIYFQMDQDSAVIQMQAKHVVKPEVYELAKEIFDDTTINVTCEERKYLGGFIGTS